MTPVQPHPKPTVTPRQWATIGLLAAVLGGVLWFHFGGSEQGSSRSEARPVSGTPSSAPSRPTQSGTATETSGKPAGEPAPPPWPALTLAEAAAYDPFQPFPERSASVGVKAKPGAKPKATLDAAQQKARQDQALASLRKTGATAVLTGSEGALAIIGRRVVRVGDELDGFRVVAIEPDGVVLQPFTVRKGHEDQP